MKIQSCELYACHTSRGVFCRASAVNIEYGHTLYLAWITQNDIEIDAQDDCNETLDWRFVRVVETLSEIATDNHCSG